MYKAFRVRRFRCFEDLSVDGLERINLIAGVNNVGKTALLEAVFLHCAAYNPEMVLRIDGFRGVAAARVEFGRLGHSPWELVFNRFDTAKTVVLEGQNTVSGRRVLELRTVGESEVAKIVGVPPLMGAEEGERAAIPMAQVLELRYEEDERKGVSHLVLDSQGIRVQPFPPPPPFPAYFISTRSFAAREAAREDVQLYGQLEIRGEHEQILEVLRMIEPRLRRVAAIAIGKEVILHGDLGWGPMLPLPVMGEGIVRLAALIVRIASARDGVVLLDEFENGLHYAALPLVWRAVRDVARRFNVQVLTTTHSRECIVAAHQAFSETFPYDFRLYRLDRVDDAISAVMYDQETLAAAIETGLEVR